MSYSDVVEELVATRKAAIEMREKLTALSEENEELREKLAHVIELLNFIEKNRKNRKGTLRAI